MSARSPSATPVDIDGTRRGHTKTYRDRAAELLPALAGDLWAWRHITPYPADSDPVVPAVTGRPMNDEDYRNFVSRRFRAAGELAGWPCAPYDLRHFNASLLIKEGRLSQHEIASHLGHTIIELSRTYAHELAEYRGRQIDIGGEITAARDGGVDPLSRRGARPGRRRGAGTRCGPGSWCAVVGRCDRRRYGRRAS